jgi:L-alanine-DL-glutamate epimerase-like enolase superfamily enzyme
LESYPQVFQPFGGFADHTPVENGLVKLTEAPGIGIEGKKELIKIYNDLSR